MNADDILFAPIPLWRTACDEILIWIVNHRGLGPQHEIYPLDRKRPLGALTLIEFADAHYTGGRSWFWRLESIKITPFQFDGVLRKADGVLPYPSYGEIGYAYYRSIEDVNLVPNTYTNYFIFTNEVDAKAAINVLTVP